RHRRVLISLFVAATFFCVAQLPDLATMTRHGAGILQFEVVGTTSRAHLYLNEWGPAGRSAARRSLWLDYGFVFCWATLFAGLCALVADRADRFARPWWARGAALLSWAILMAGLADLIENTAVLAILAGHVRQPFPLTSTLSALTVFVLKACSLVFPAACGVGVPARRSAS